MPGSSPPRCSIVPPYVLEALTKAENARTAEAARETIRLTEQLERDRLLAIERGKRHLADERRVVYDAAHAHLLPGTLLRREGDTACADPSANAAFDHAGQTFSFFGQIFGRSSIDGRGMRLLSSVHYGKHYDNAFWNGTEMVYGDGDGVVLGDFTKSLDVIAHELTHGLTESTANIEYSGQSGALNESVSDVFGSLVKQWVHGQRAIDADWLIGATPTSAPTHVPKRRRCRRRDDGALSRAVRGCDRWMVRRRHAVSLVHGLEFHQSLLTCTRPSHKERRTLSPSTGASMKHVPFVVFPLGIGSKFASPES